MTATDGCREAEKQESFVRVHLRVHLARKITCRRPMTWLQCGA